MATMTTACGHSNTYIITSLESMEGIEKCESVAYLEYLTILSDNVLVED